MLHGRRLPLLANNLEFDVDSINDNTTLYTKIFQYLIKKLNHFASLWRNEYLLDLRERHRHKPTGEVQIQKGDIDLIKEDNMKRNHVKMEIVETLTYGRDGVIRGAKVRACYKGEKDYLNRPLKPIFST